jgi:hypothetical protein
MVVYGDNKKEDTLESRFNVSELEKAIKEQIRLPISMDKGR